MLQATCCHKKRLGGTGDEYGYLLKPTKEGGYILNGQTTSNDGDVKGNHGDADAWVVKLDQSLTITWQKTLGSTQYEDNYCITELEDGGYFVGALTNGNDGDVSGNHGGYDAWLVRLNEKGELVWQKTVGGTGDENPTNLLPTADGGYLIGGQTNSGSGGAANYHGDFDEWLFTVKLE